MLSVRLRPRWPFSWCVADVGERPGPPPRRAGPSLPLAIVVVVGSKSLGGVSEPVRLLSPAAWHDGPDTRKPFARETSFWETWGSAEPGQP